MKKIYLKKYIPIVLFVVLSGSLLFFATYFAGNSVQNKYHAAQSEVVQQQVSFLSQNVTNLILIKNRELNTITRALDEIIDAERNLKILPDDSVLISVRIKNAGHTQEMYLPSMLYEDSNIWGDKELPKKIRRLTNAHFNILLKIPGGYVQVFDNERNTGDFLPEFMHISHPAAQSIERDVVYRHRVITDFDSRLVQYSPLYINGNLRGMIECSIDEGISGFLSKTFQTNTNFEYKPFLVHSSGTPILNNADAVYFKDENLLNQMFEQRSSYSEIFYRFATPSGIKDLQIHYTYLPQYGMYAGVFLPESSLRFLSNRETGIMLIFLIVIFLAVNLMFTLFVLKYNSQFESIIEAAERIAAGNTAEAKHTTPDNPGGKALLEVINYLENIAGFARAIISDKEYKHYKPAQNDVPGQALLELKEDKNMLREKSLIKKFTAEIKQKTEKGKSKINELLQYAHEVEPLALGVIRIIYEIFEIDQIGFFLVKRENDQKYLELQAAFAYNEERYFQGKVLAEESLTGRAILEKESIFLKNLPPDYLKISAGFGQTSPGTLAIIPLIFNNEVQAVIEIAAMKDIQSYQIKFLEEVGENIASTISNIINSKKTEELLKQTEEQSKQIEIQRTQLQEKIETHRRQNRRIDKELNEQREILNSIRNAVFMIEFSLNGEVLSVNKNMTEIFGVSENDVLNKKHKDLIVSENYREQYAGFFRDLSKDKVKYSKETISLRKDVQMKFSVIYSPLRNARGRIRTILLMAHKLD